MSGSGGDGVGGVDSGAARMGDSTAGAAGDTGGAAPFDVTASKTLALCPSQSYQVQLSAVGGVSPYTWALADGTPDGTVLSATTGDNVQVSGVASAPQPDLQLTVHDAHGDIVTTSVTLTVEAVGPGLCPRITPTRLPDPCQDNSYYTNDVTVSGGTAPFVWQAVSIPDGLSFDATTQTLTGTALASGAATPLTLLVTDHKGRQTQMTYPLAYRDRCWLGFTSTEAGASKVHLFDPALSARAPSLEASANNTGVVDFKFSPDGKFLAYRRSSGSPATESLVLAIAPHWQEQVLSIAGTVLEYSWSENAGALAVAYNNGTDTLLGGVNVTAAVAGSGGGITGIQALTSVVMLDSASAPLQSELLWFQSDTFLAFHADAGFGFDSPYYTHFDGTVFSTVNPMGFSLYDPGMQLLPAHNGIFVVSPETPPQLDFYSSAGGNDFDVYLADAFTSGVADPEGSYVALPISDKVQIFLTSESGGTTDPPTPWQPSTDECNSILAWDPSRERIACDARGTPPDGGPAQGEVRLFELAGTNAVPQITSTAMKALTSYQQGDSIGQRRSFSAQGKWLAFTTDTGLYLGSVQEAPQVLLQVPLPEGALPGETSELVFSPDETLLLWQRGARLAAIPLQKNQNFTWYGAGLDGPLQAPEPCNEEFTAGPSKWCGRLLKSSAPTWSIDSRFAATNTATHGVRVYNLEHYSVGAAPHVEACVSGCFGDFEFQP